MSQQRPLFRDPSTGSVSEVTSSDTVYGAAAPALGDDLTNKTYADAHINGAPASGTIDLGAIPIGQPDGSVVWGDPVVQGVYPDGSTVASPGSAGDLSTIQPVYVGGKSTDGKLYGLLTDSSKNLLIAGAVAQSGTWNIGTVTTVSAVTAITNALPAGSNVIGHVITDTGSTTVVTGTVAVSGTVAATQSGPWIVTSNAGTGFQRLSPGQFIQAPTGTTFTTQTAPTCVFANPVTAGNTLLVAVQYATTAPSSVVDNLGNIYFALSSHTQGSFSIAVYYCSAINGGACTVTVNFGSGQTGYFSIFEYYGVMARDGSTTFATTQGNSSGFSPTLNVPTSTPARIVGPSFNFAFLHATTSGGTTPPTPSAAVAFTVSRLNSQFNGRVVDFSHFAGDMIVQTDDPIQGAWIQSGNNYYNIILIRLVFCTPEDYLAWVGPTNSLTGSWATPITGTVALAAGTIVEVDGSFIDVSGSTIAGLYANNGSASSGDTTQVGVLAGVSTAAAPAYTEGFITALSTDLTGRLRVLRGQKITLQASQVSATTNTTSTRTTTLDLAGFEMASILINITGAGTATGTLQLWLEDSVDGGTTWNDLVSSNTFTFGASVVTQAFFLQGKIAFAGTQGAAQAIETLAAGTVRQGPWGERIRVREKVSGVSGSPTGVTYTINAVFKQ